MKPPVDSVLVDALIISMALIIISMIIFAITMPFSKRDKRNSVLIVGITGDSDDPAVGKTSIFKALRYGSLPKHGTVPSMQVNEDTFTPYGASDSFQPIHWIDFPGHSRLRHNLQKYLNVAKCIVFVVDAQRFNLQARRDAELMYEILTDNGIANNAIPMLVFCNKSETSTAVNTNIVQTRLEAELERARMASKSVIRSAQVGNNDDSGEGIDADEDRAFLGFENETFSFDHVQHVSFHSGSALNGDLDPIINFARSSFL